MKKSTKILGVSMFGILLLLGLTTAVNGQTAYDLNVHATSNWDIGSDSSGNVYIIWSSNTTIYFGKIVNHAVSGQQTVATDAKTDKYGWPRLAVQGNGQSMSIIYRTTTSTLKHAWRNSAVFGVLKQSLPGQLPTATGSRPGPSAWTARCMPHMLSPEYYTILTKKWAVPGFHA